VVRYLGVLPCKHLLGEDPLGESDWLLLLVVRGGGACFVRHAVCSHDSSVCLDVCGCMCVVVCM